MKPFSFLLTAICMLLAVPTMAQQPKFTQLDPQTTLVYLKVDGLKRKFVVHLPPSFQNPPAQGFPIVFMFHGGGGGGENAFETTKWKEVGDANDFITVFPTAYETCIIKDSTPSTKRYWMTEGKLASLCPGQTPHDDVAFVEQILVYLRANYSIDSRRIYASGFSNGMGFSLSKLLVEMPETFAAIAGVGSLLQNSLGAVTNAPPVFVLVGEDDDRFYPKAGLPSLPITEADFEASVFMKDMQHHLLDMLQLDPAYQIRERPKYMLYRFNQSIGKGAPELRFGVLKGIKHVYPQGRTNKDNGIIIAEIFWDFFRQYQR